MSSKYLIAPSILAADFGRLNEEIEVINQSEADYLHVDVMDGRFVPNISFGQNIVKAMHKHSTKPLDVHLMIEEPERYVEEFIDAGADIVTFHIEATNHVHRVIQMIKSAGAKAGLAFNPHTNIALGADVFEDLDLVLIMSVNPGFGGQKFIYQALPKIQQLKGMLDERNLSPIIEIDGGVGLQNAEAILKAGCNMLVAGSSVFKSPDPTKTIRQLKAFDFDTKFN